MGGWTSASIEEIRSERAHLILFIREINYESDRPY